MAVAYSKIDKEMLAELLKQHLLFIARKTGGKLLHLRFVDLSNFDFAGMDFSDAELVGVNFEGSNLSRAKFVRCNLNGSNFRKANLQHSNLSKANLRGVFLAGADLSFSDLSEADFRETNVAKTDTRGGFQVLKHVKQFGEADGANFTGATLDKSQFNGASAIGAVFAECSMRGVKLNGAQLKNCDLSGANLEGADLFGAKIEGASFKDAILTNVNFGANPPKADMLDGALMSPDSAAMEEAPYLRKATIEHQDWWESGGASGRHADLSGKDLRPLAAYFKKI